MTVDEMNDGVEMAGKTMAINRKTELGPTFVDVYANDTQIQTSPWDVRFQFGLIRDIDAGSQTLIIQRTVDVRMSPQHAKRVATILRQQIDMYEKTFGPIPEPPV